MSSIGRIQLFHGTPTDNVCLGPEYIAIGTLAKLSMSSLLLYTVVVDIKYVI